MSPGFTLAPSSFRICNTVPSCCEVTSTSCSTVSTEGRPICVEVEDVDEGAGVAGAVGADAAGAAAFTDGLAGDCEPPQPASTTASAAAAKLQVRCIDILLLFRPLMASTTKSCATPTGMVRG